MKDRVKQYTADGIGVHFEPRRCIHAAECVFGLPLVFDPERRPWIEPAAADPDAIAGVVERCPTGALHHERRDGGPAEAPDAVNRIRTTRNGPLQVRGTIELRRADGSTLTRDVRMALCRCGESHNKPFCDNSHRAIRFLDGGDVFAGDVKAAGPDDPRTLRITPEDGGPYRVEGPVEIVSADGRVRLAAAGATLCRCGGSHNKPFCDGTHRTVGVSPD